MIGKLSSLAGEWSSYDTWIVITAALAAVACALPGNYLLLRRQSLLGDALSHAVLPGIVGGYLTWSLVESSGWFPVAEVAGWRQLALLAGAAVSGVLAVLLVEATQRWGRLDAGSALGVVFTSFFALGLLLIRQAADSAHIDPSCVLYGNLELIVLDTVPGTTIPRAAVVNGLAAAFNLALWLMFYKELQLTAFDPGFAETIGIPASKVNYGVTTVTAITVVAAFETVGSILVIAMLIVPVATARLLTDRLPTMIAISALAGGLSAILGAVGAIVLPEPIFDSLGFSGVEDAGTAGMMALATGGLFVAALVAGPKYGLLRRSWDRLWWRIQVAADDILGVLFRQEEASNEQLAMPASQLLGLLSHPRWIVGLARQRLTAERLLTTRHQRYELTDAGRHRAKELVRSHRLWEAFLAQKFRVPEERVHVSAEKIEHYLGETLRGELAAELQQSTADPHGRTIPPEGG